MTDTMCWLVYAPSGELIATTRYACDAAKLAINYGAGARVMHDGKRMVLTVSESTALEGALPIADEMIALAYRRPAA